MKIKQLPRKIYDKSLRYLLGLVGIDYISFAKILPRQDLKEIGSKYGGWVVPTDIFDSNSICYCAGCGEDISFDLGMIEKFNLNIYAFDPTPRAVEHVNKTAGDNSKFHFLKLGLWDKKDILKFFVPKDPKHVSHSLVNLQNTEDYIEVEVDRLKHVMENNDHKSIDLLKLDIEGAEYKVIESLLQDDLDVKVICVEYDEYYHALDSGYKKRISKSIRSLLNRGYSLACAQGNGNYTFVK